MTVRQHAEETPIVVAIALAIAALVAAGFAFQLVGAIGIYIFIVSVLFSIGLHEFGHFITAKRFGMRVHKFYIGFPPRIWSVTRGETEYGIGAVPFGGFVKIAGMNPFEDVPPEDRDRVFKAKKPWKRAIVLAAGSFTHFVLAIVILSTILVVHGRENADRPTTTIANVQGGTAAARAGLQPGDTLVGVDGTAVDSWSQVQEAVKARPEETVTLTYRRDGATRTATARLGRLPNDATKGYLGVSPGYVLERFGPVEAVGESFVQLGNGIVASLKGLGTLFSPSSITRLFRQVLGVETREVTDPATVVGIGSQAGGLGRRGDFVSLFLLVAGFNVFVGVANLLPLPPLDGGHLAVLAYEKIARRDVDMRKLMPVSAAVIAVFGSLFVLLLYLDIVRPLPSIPG